MESIGGPILTPDENGNILLQWETDITKDSIIPPTTKVVKEALGTKVSSIKSGSAGAVTPVNGVATMENNM